MKKWSFINMKTHHYLNFKQTRSRFARFSNRLRFVFIWTTRKKSQHIFVVCCNNRGTQYTLRAVLLTPYRPCWNQFQYFGAKLFDQLFCMNTISDVVIRVRLRILASMFITITCLCRSIVVKSASQAKIFIQYLVF